MAYVVTEKCIKCKFTTCVEVCPVSCFHEGPEFLVINPEECIDCGVCVMECPIDAIFHESDLPEDQKDFININATLSKHWKIIFEAKEPLESAELWIDVPDKRKLLNR